MVSIPVGEPHPLMLWVYIKLGGVCEEIHALTLESSCAGEKLCLEIIR